MGKITIKISAKWGNKYAIKGGCSIFRDLWTISQVAPDEYEIYTMEQPINITAFVVLTEKDSLAKSIRNIMYTRFGESMWMDLKELEEACKLLKNK